MCLITSVKGSVRKGVYVVKKTPKIYPFMTSSKKEKKEGKKGRSGEAWRRVRVI
jgi:hypothetical protein